MTRRPVLALVCAAALALAALLLLPSGAGADNTITVDPAVDVVDGQEVEASASGFEPRQSVAFTQCPAATGPGDSFDPSDCDLGTITVTRAAGTGVATTQDLTVYRFIPGPDGPIDCAEAGDCVIYADLFGPDVPGPTRTDTAPIQFVSTIVNEPPLELTAMVDDWTSRTVDVTITCSRRATVTIDGSIVQNRKSGSASAIGSVQLPCTDTVSTTVPLAPHQEDFEGSALYPFRRLKNGAATVGVDAHGLAGRWNVTESTELPITLHMPDLEKRVRRSASDDLVVRLAGVRVTKSGRTAATAEVTCARPARDVEVELRLVAPGPGGTFHPATDHTRIDRCNGTTTVELDVSGTGYPRLPFRADVLPRGPAEAYLTAAPMDSPYDDSVDMRPLTLRRDILPETIRVKHSERSRLRIGAATVKGVKVSLTCGRDATFTVFAAVGQRQDDVVLQRAGRRVVPCTEGRTKVFEIRWPGQVRAQKRSAINLRAINGNHEYWDGPWQQIQSGWRITNPS